MIRVRKSFRQLYDFPDDVHFEVDGNTICLWQGNADTPDADADLVMLKMADVPDMIRLLTEAHSKFQKDPNESSDS